MCMFNITASGDNPALEAQTSAKKSFKVNHQGVVTPFNVVLGQAAVSSTKVDETPDISAQAKQSYQAIKAAVEQSQSKGSGKGSEFQIMDKTLDAIVNEPIDIKMTAQELKRSIIFARLGIDYEKVKELEEKIDMLSLAKQEIEHSSTLSSADKNTLLARISQEKQALEEQIESLLKGHNAEGVDALEQVLYGKEVQSDALLSNLQMASEFQLKVTGD